MPVVISILISISLAFIASASSGIVVPHGELAFWQKQFIFAGIGFAVYFTISRVHYRYFLEFAHWIYYLSLAGLLLLWVPGISKSGGWGAARWVGIGSFTFQPAELAKIGTLLMACSILARSEVGTLSRSLLALLKVAAAVLIPFVLIFAQPDLGSAMVLPPMTLCLLYVSNLTITFFRTVALIALGLFALLTVDLIRYVHYVQEHNLSFLDGSKLEKKNDKNSSSKVGLQASNVDSYQKHGLLPLKDYQRNRILAFVAPSLVDPSGTGVSWNQRQSLITVGSGGFIGKGWKEGTQAKLGYLPQTVAHNDFIFSVIAEETGFVGATCILALFAILIANSLQIAAKASDRFGRLLAVGVCAIFMTHIFVNIAMTIGLMPIKGIPLPFISYGGSFLLSAFILMGMVASVDRFRLSRAT